MSIIKKKTVTVFSFLLSKITTYFKYFLTIMEFYRMLASLSVWRLVLYKEVEK